jgi:hypothetical protein
MSILVTRLLIDRLPLTSSPISRQVSVDTSRQAVELTEMPSSATPASFAEPSTLLLARHSGDFDLDRFLDEINLSGFNGI